MGQYARYPSLKDKSVFITGGASGIGASIVEHFCEQGARVFFVDINAEAAEQTRARCHSTGGQVAFAELDLRDIDALRQAINEASTLFGPVDVLINNAAHDERHAIDSVTPEYWDDRMHVNLRHQFFTAQAVHSAMADNGGGVIVNIGSVTYMIGQGGMPGYSAAKSGVYGLTRSLAADLGSANIRVNCIIPGWILTERQRELWLTEESLNTLMTNQNVKRELVPADVARVVLFYAAADSSACTGQMYVVDGGWL